MQALVYAISSSLLVHQRLRGESSMFLFQTIVASGCQSSDCSYTMLTVVCLNMRAVTKLSIVVSRVLQTNFS